MGEKSYLSSDQIDTIDKELDEEFNEKDDSASSDEEEVEEGSEEIDLSSMPQLEEDEEEEEDEDQKAKPDKAKQQEYAFARLREEKAAAEKKAVEQEAFMKKLASASGYEDDVDSYKKDLEKRLIEEEAKRTGVTPDFYRELSDAKSKLAGYEQERSKTERASKSQRFLNTISEVLSSYDVDVEETSQELFDSLEKAGYTIDALLSIPQPEFIIRGALYDKLNKSSLKEGKIKSKVDTKKIGSSSGAVKTIDELLDEEMAEYAKSRGIKVPK